MKNNETHKIKKFPGIEKFLNFFTFHPVEINQNITYKPNLDEILQNLNLIIKAEEDLMGKAEEDHKSESDKSVIRLLSKDLNEEISKLEFEEIKPPVIPDKPILPPILITKLNKSKLNPIEKLELLERVMMKINKNSPIIGEITDPNFREAIEESKKENWFKQVKKSYNNIGILFMDRLKFQNVEPILGEHIFSVPLTPGEELTLIQESKTKRTKSFEDIKDQVDEQSQEYNSEWSTELSDGISDSLSKTENMSVSASLGFSYFVAVSAQASYDVSTSASNTSNHNTVKVKKVSEKAASKLKTQHKTVFKLTEEEESVYSSKRIIRNPNINKSVTYSFYKIYNKIKVSMERFDARLCARFFVPDPGKLLRSTFKDSIAFANTGFDTSECDVYLGSSQLFTKLRTLDWPSDDYWPSYDATDPNKIIRKFDLETSNNSRMRTINVGNEIARENDEDYFYVKLEAGETITKFGIEIEDFKLGAIGANFTKLLENHMINNWVQGRLIGTGLYPPETIKNYNLLCGLSVSYHGGSIDTFPYSIKRAEESPDLTPYDPYISNINLTKITIDPFYQEHNNQDGLHRYYCKKLTIRIFVSVSKFKDEDEYNKCITQKLSTIQKIDTEYIKDTMESVSQKYSDYLNKVIFENAFGTVFDNSIGEEYNPFQKRFIEIKHYFDWENIHIELSPWWMSKHSSNERNILINELRRYSDVYPIKDNLIDNKFISSYAQVLLPINLAYEVEAMKLMDNIDLTGFVSEFYEWYQQTFNVKIEKDDFGTPRVKEVDEIGMKTSLISSWHEFVPTDGTHIEPFIGKYSAMDKDQKVLSEKRNEVDIDHTKSISTFRKRVSFGLLVLLIGIPVGYLIYLIFRYLI